MGSYIDSNMMSGESVEYAGKVSLMSLLPLFIIGLILLPIFVGILFWIAAALRFFTTEMAITNKRVIAKWGFIRRETVEISLPKIESVRVSQNILGRIFNFGSIVVAGAGNPAAPVPGISRPLDFRKRFYEIQEAIGATT